MPESIDDFFTPVSSKCMSCGLTKKKTISIEEKNAPFIVKKNGKGEMLILLETPEDKKTLDKFIAWLQYNRITNYTIANAYGCRTNKYDIVTPLNKGYVHCSMFDYSVLNEYKVIVPVGRALHAVTGTDDIPSWHEFMEYIFNDTFFYTPYEFNKIYKKMLRVYPIPKLIEFVKTDTFPESFARIQFKNARDFLKQSKIEVFKDATLIKVDDPSDFFEKTKEYDSFSWDTETNSLNVFQDNFKVGCLTISFDGEYGYYLPFNKINKRQLSAYFKDKKQTGANIKYDMKVMRRVGISNTQANDDVILLFHVLNTVKTRLSLKTIAWSIGYGGYDQPLEDYKSKHKIKNYLEIPESVMFPYATLDSVVTEKAKQYLYKQGRKQPELFGMYRDVLMPTIPVYLKAEMKGIPVNTTYINLLTDYYKKKADEAKEKAWIIAGEQFDIGSNDEIGRVFKKMGLPSLGLTKKKTYQTDEDRLIEWEKMGYPIAKEVVAYRKASHMISSFAGNIDTGETEKESSIEDWFYNESDDSMNGGLVRHIQSDGRIHTDFKFALQYTFRSAANNPNFTQMPKRGDEGKIFRPVFMPDPDFAYGEQDYSGLQLRITAAYSKDKVMSDIFTIGHGDPHSESAQAFFARNITVEEFIAKKKEKPYKGYRDKAKGDVNFALIFSDDYYVLVRPIKLNWTKEEKEEYLTNIPENEWVYDKEGNFQIENTIAKDIHAKFFERYSGIYEYIKDCHTIAIKQGYIDSIGGIRRHLPYLTHVPKNEYTDSQKIKGFKNVSVNTRAQATEAWLMYKVLVRLNNAIEERGLRSWIVGTVHDAIVTMDHKDELAIMAKLKQECMDDYETFEIPLLSEIDNGPVWGFGTELNSSMTNEEMLDNIKQSWKVFVFGDEKNKPHPILSKHPELIEAYL